VQSLTRWKKRWVVLKEGSLEYLTSDGKGAVLSADQSIVIEPSCAPAAASKGRASTASSSSSSSIVKGIIPLSKSTLITRSTKKHSGKYFVLQLQSPGTRKKSYFLYHSNEEELQGWFTAINNAIERLNRLRYVNSSSTSPLTN
jgi:hypothetical protein